MTTLARERPTAATWGDTIPALRPTGGVYAALESGESLNLYAAIRAATTQVVRIATTGNVRIAARPEAEPADAGALLPGGVEYVRVNADDDVVVVALEAVTVSISEC